MVTEETEERSSLIAAISSMAGTHFSSSRYLASVVKIKYRGKAAFTAALAESINGYSDNSLRSLIKYWKSSDTGVSSKSNRDDLLALIAAEGSDSETIVMDYVDYVFPYKLPSNHLRVRSIHVAGDLRRYPQVPPRGESGDSEEDALKLKALVKVTMELHLAAITTTFSIPSFNIGEQEKAELPLSPDKYSISDEHLLNATLKHPDSADDIIKMVLEEQLSGYIIEQRLDSGQPALSRGIL